jgi:hypothetical protein
MSLGIDEPASAGSEPDPDRPTVIGGSTRFVPGQSNDRITIVNGNWVSAWSTCGATAIC